MRGGEQLTRASFRDLQPIRQPGAMSRLPDRVWADEEWNRIRRGYRAWEMEEKWNVFAEGSVVSLHRSWTGRGIYQATFTPAAQGGKRISSAVVETDLERYRSPGEDFDRVMLELVLSAIVLGEPAAELRASFVELSTRAPGRSDLPGAVVLHSGLGLRHAATGRTVPTSPDGTGST